MTHQGDSGGEAAAQPACTPLPPCFLCMKGAVCTARVQKGTECPSFSDKQTTQTERHVPPDGFDVASDQSCDWPDSSDVVHSPGTRVLAGGNTE